jgi:hypothetical protein
MICLAALHYSSRILKANGTYESVKNVKVNDYVMNMNGKPVKIKKIYREKEQTRVLTTIKSEQWYARSKFSDDQLIMTLDEKDDLTWGTISTNKRCLLPKSYLWKLSNNFSPIEYKDSVLEPSFKLGFFLGCFLRTGVMKKLEMEKKTDNTSIPDVSFYCMHYQNEVMTEIKDIASNILQSKVVHTEREMIHDIDIYDDDLYNLLEEFGFATTRYLPPAYYCTNIDFIKGLNRGIVLSGHHGEPIMNNMPMVYEAFFWTFMSLEKPPRGLNTVLYDKNLYVSSYNIENKSKIDEADMYDILVDCPTNTMIVDNLITFCKPPV